MRAVNMECIPAGVEGIIFYFVLYLTCAAKAEMISKCGVNGEPVHFQCNSALYWHINYASSTYAAYTDNITVTADIENTISHTVEYGVTTVSCTSSEGDFEAFLFVADELHPQVPLQLPITPIIVNQTTLRLEWEEPPILMTNDNITLRYQIMESIGQNYQQLLETEDTSLELNFDGQECQPFLVNISIPGNCDSVTVMGMTLIDPPYPMIQNIVAIALSNKSIALSWQHPADIFEETVPVFTYNITAVLEKTGSVLEQYLVTFDSSDTPREVFNFSDVDFCEEINFILSQVGDCRENSTTVALPIFPEYFVSEVDTKVLFSESGDVAQVEITFEPPELCSFQRATASYMLSFSDGNSTWSTEPKALPSNVKVDEEAMFLRDHQYTVTATVLTDHGNVSSTTNFSTVSPLGEATIDESTLVYESLEDSTVLITWQQPLNTLRDSFTYVVIATVVSSGVTIEIEKAFAIDDTPLVEFDLKAYSCEEVKFTISIFNRNRNISLVRTLPAYPSRFAQNVTADVFTLNGKIKELEITFTPPQLCSFQSAYYMLSFTSDGNETWSREPVAITDTSQPVREDIETGFVLNVNYTVTVTVFMEHRNLTSAANFSFTPQDMGLQWVWGGNITTGLSALKVGGIVGGAVVALLLVLVCGCAGGVMVVYLLRQRKRRKMKEGLSSHGKFRPTVTNPIYETGEDVYEELPDQEGNKASKLTSDQLYSDVAPALPPARYDYLPTADRLPPGNEGTSATPLTQTPKQDRKLTTLDIPKSESAGALSTGSGEDCYTAMSPAGTVTLMPRNRHSGSHSMTSGEAAGSVEGRFTLNCV